MLVVSATAGWQPRAPIDWNGAARHGPLFDPMREFSSTAKPSSSTDRPLLLSLPGLDGHPLTAFVQFPALSRDYDVLQWQPDRSNANAGGDHAGLVSEICAYVARESERRDVILMGESFGGVQALDVALRANEHLSGVIAVNPATSFPRTDLPEIAEEMLAAPAWRFALMSAWLFGTRVGDAQQTRTILKTLVDNPINDPERTPPELAEYLNAAIPAFVAGFSTPRDYFLQRLASLGPAAEAVNAALDSGGAAALGGTPLLIVAGTADRLALSESESARLRGLLGDDACSVHLVEGAGHSGTLDDRIDLRRVVQEWRSKF